MKIFLSAIFACLISLILLPMPVLAQENLRTGEITILSKNEIIDKDYFATGSRVMLSGTVNGDAYLAGGNVVVDGVVNGDLLVAGGDVEVRGQVQNLRVAGGNVTVTGNIAGNITAVGGDIKINKESTVAGSLTTAGGNVTVESPIGRGITAASGNLILANSVGGDIVAAGERVNLDPGAKIAGNLTYYSQNPAVISQDASVSGVLTHNLPPQRPRSNNAAKAAAGFGFAWAVFNFISALVVGVLAILLGPNIIRQKAETILQKPWPSLGIGLLTVILAPVLILVLLVTLIGIPIAIAVMVFYILLLFFVKIFISIAIGIKLFGLLKQKANLYMCLFAGLIIYVLITSVPVIGWLISLLAVLTGLGAFILTDYTFYQSLRSKKLI